MRIPPPPVSSSTPETLSRELSCCICVCVRDNEKGLPAVLENIRAIRRAGIFQRLTVSFFFDISRDNSLLLLQEFRRTWEPSEDITLFVQTAPTAQYLHSPKTARLALSRNTLLRHFRGTYPHFAYYAVMDANDYACIDPIQKDVLQRAINNRDAWDAISFNRSRGYYDHWALSFDPFVYSFFHFADWQAAVAAMRERWEIVMTAVPTGDLLQVYSAFNGFALYKASAFEDCYYSSTIDPALFPPGTLDRHRQAVGGTNTMKTGLQNDCEHRRFHLEAIRRWGARIRIDLTPLFVQKPESTAADPQP